MPAWVKDHDIWEKAKKAVDKNKYKNENSYWAVVATVYKNMGGKTEGFIEKEKVMKEILKLEEDIKAKENPIEANPENPLRNTKAVITKNVPEDKENESKDLVEDIEKISEQISIQEQSVGKHNDVPDENFDPEQLKAGMKIEREHTNDAEVAKSIAKDHLTEDKEYYIKLIKMEGTTVAEYLQSKKEFIRQIESRIYLQPGQKPPKGVAVQRGKNGGMYYDTTARVAGATSATKEPSNKISKAKEPDSQVDYHDRTVKSPNIGNYDLEQIIGKYPKSKSPMTKESEVNFNEDVDTDYYIGTVPNIDIEMDSNYNPENDEDPVETMFKELKIDTKERDKKGDLNRFGRIVTLPYEILPKLIKKYKLNREEVIDYLDQFNVYFGKEPKIVGHYHQPDLKVEIGKMPNVKPKEISIDRRIGDVVFDPKTKKTAIVINKKKFDYRTGSPDQLKMQTSDGKIFYQTWY